MKFDIRTQSIDGELAYLFSLKDKRVEIFFRRQVAIEKILDVMRSAFEKDFRALVDLIAEESGFPKWPGRQRAVEEAIKNLEALGLVQLESLADLAVCDHAHGPVPSSSQLVA